MFGILEGNRFIASEGEFLDYGSIEMRLWFSVRDVFDTAKVVEMIEQPKTREMAFDVNVIGIGGESDFQAQLSRLLQVIGDAGQHGLLGKYLTFYGIQLAFESSAVSGGTKRGPRVEVEVDAADSFVSELPGKDFVGALVNDFTGIDQRRFRVENQTIEIKHKRANHENGVS